MFGRSSLVPPQLTPAIPTLRPIAVTEPPRPSRNRSRTRGAKARLALASFAAILVAANAAFAVALDARLPLVRFPEYGHRLASVQQLRAEHPDRPLVLAVGSSRTQMALNPAATGLPEGPRDPLVFNFGLAGALPVHHPLGYRRLRADGVKPDAVIVEIFPALLCVPDAAHTVYAESGAGLTAAELASLAPNTHDPEPVRRWVQSRAFGPAAHLQSIQRQIVPDLFPAHYWLPLIARFPNGTGFHAFPAKEISDADRQRATDKAVGAYRQMCREMPLHPMAERAYREVVAACRADGVPVALYLTAEAPLFRELYTPESRAALAAFVRVFTGELGVPVFDLSDGWETGDFWDGHHMLPGGAEKFSRRLADRHLRPWLATVLPAR
ncbi:DUF1574 domain-containing protein [Gemmata sp. JC673]|uniref:DUF1574 domain-containing protein n=1 Tax=Gemmata algarum TaxID=2975278 RepID=A0ABU5EZF8_9BACT|nr:hypothetical protein [Gemmata algarum]MDY3560303.1 DUF1574 domain-containing protein [Gemmata algarum]